MRPLRTRIHCERTPRRHFFQISAGPPQEVGLDTRRNGRELSPSFLYQQAPLCVFCSQFFETAGLSELHDSPKSRSPTRRRAGSPSKRRMGETSGSAASEEGPIE
eukprot:TRINITY_DN427_c0_g1_i2.p2 TRINITY_DN427_c0_g1~~TRINITY_DN427_c0_g1_i2.p2  ORF type:complete len:105 (-),score=15.81 TRINITY_DN427_c0_g1_i2:33-347(-)